MPPKRGRPFKGKEPTGYNGNEFLKRTNVSIEWDEHKVNELAKCAEDPKYFIENYVKIVTLDEGLSQFKLRDYQQEIIDTFTNQRLVILLIGRQSGKCQSADTLITLKDKKTGEISKISIGEFYKAAKNSNI